MYTLAQPDFCRRLEKADSSASLRNGNEKTKSCRSSIAA
jgi:hypothetical protein